MTYLLKSGTFDRKQIKGNAVKKQRKGVKQKIYQLWQEEMEEKGFNRINRFKQGLLIITALVLMTSCVSKKMLVEEQNRSKKVSKDLNQCETENQKLLNANKDLSGKIILPENQLANEQSKGNILDQPMHFNQLNSRRKSAQQTNRNYNSAKIGRVF